ncbi:MAG TPA: hypothetical protein VFL12_04715 [Thermoanaerobaculia bacterium]|nr:hypothetical protein [Thermoanaerobaculia bacterium]
MRFLLPIVANGWPIAILLGVEILFPYLPRRRSGRAARPATVAGVSRRELRPHYGLGLLLPLGALAHAGGSMRALHGRPHGSAGLWIATAVLALLPVQVVFGFALRRSRGREVRKWHFWTMVLMAAGVAIHIALDA